MGVTCYAPTGVPAGSTVTTVSVHHEITHTYIGDLQVQVYNANHTWAVRTNEGGSAQNINETRSTSLFSGDNPAQNWYYGVRDTASGDVGTLTAMNLYVYYVLPQPDLTPYQPTAWTDKLPVGITQLGYSATHNYSGPYYDNQTLYFNWSVLNQGTVAASGYRVHVEVTGTGGGSWDWTGVSTLASWWVCLTTDHALGPLAAGAHTIKIWADYDNTVSESNESNNYYEHTFTVTATAQPDLTPYLPSAWTDKLPVGITQLAGGSDGHGWRQLELDRCEHARRRHYLCCH